MNSGSDAETKVMSSEDETKGKLRGPIRRDACCTRACKSDDFRWRLWACLCCDPRLNRFPVRHLFFPEVDRSFHLNHGRKEASGAASCCSSVVSRVHYAGVEQRQAQG